MRARHFAMPWILVTACGGRVPTAEELRHSDRSWSLESDEYGCFADENTGDCDDSEHTCNPPEPMEVRCVYGDADLVDEMYGHCWAGSPAHEVPCPPEVEIEPPPAPPEEKEHPPWLDDGPY